MRSEREKYRRKRRKMPVQDGRFELEFRPYEIKAICLRVDKS